MGIAPAPLATDADCIWRLFQYNMGVVSGISSQFRCYAMYCHNCGTQLSPPDARFCCECGTLQNSTAPDNSTSVDHGDKRLPDLGKQSYFDRLGQSFMNFIRTWEELIDNLRKPEETKQRIRGLEAKVRSLEAEIEQLRERLREAQEQREEDRQRLRDQEAKLTETQQTLERLRPQTPTWKKRAQALSWTINTILIPVIINELTERFDVALPQRQPPEKEPPPQPPVINPERPVPIQAPTPSEEAPRRSTPTPKPLIEFDWVTIPAGEFLMGSDPVKDSMAQEAEMPQHRVYISEFRIARVPVTNTQYKLFVDATGRRKPHHWGEGEIPVGKENHPVIFVTWNDAQVFCQWARSTSAYRSGVGESSTRYRWSHLSLG